MACSTCLKVRKKINPALRKLHLPELNEKQIAPFFKPEAKPRVNPAWPTRRS